MKLGIAAVCSLFALSAAGCVVVAEHQLSNQCATQGKRTFFISTKEEGIPLVVDEGSAEAICVGPNDAIPMPQTFGAEVIWSSSFKGVGIMSVAPNSVASRAGLKVDDILYEYDGHAISQPDELKSAIEQTPVGAQIPIALTRNGRKVAVTAQF